MMRDRLIEAIDKSEVSFCCFPVGDCEDKEKEKLADYLLADGWIRPPMKLGQICFKPCDYLNEVDECRVSSITQKADGTFKIRLTNLRGKWCFEITADNIGKTVFLTREQAEKALAKRDKKTLQVETYYNKEEYIK